jgi:Na+/proline symporter
MRPSLEFWDYFIIGSYLLFALLVGFVLSKKASESSDNYFLGGRNMPWWLIGISMVATSYASDTPLAITEMVRKFGIQRIWWFLSSCLVLIVGIFLFSRLWRRAEITTDAEFYELRYDGKSAAFLRGFRAAFAGIVQNLITMGWVILAMSSIITTLTDVNKWMAIGILVAVALTYATFSGFYGVVVTDFVQFFIAIGSMIYLAWVAIARVGGLDNMYERIANSVGQETLNIFPDFSTFNLDLLALFIFVGVIWWNDANGYNMQRMSACKDERHSILATIFYAIFQTSRAWIWVGVALVSLVLFPELSHTPYTETQAYPLVMNTYLGAGVKGILITAFLAAFMSTIDTHLNWGASYIMTDVYKRFIKKEASERHYMIVTKIVVVIMMISASLLVPLMTSVTAAWEFLALIGVGGGFIMFLRWFWWRINAYTEITALALGLLLAVVNLVIPADYVMFGFPWAEMRFEIKIALFTAIVLPISFLVTFLTPPVSKEKLEAFYKRIRPGGLWKVVSQEVRDLPGGAINVMTIVDVLAGIFLCFGLSLGIGYLLIQQPGKATFCFGLAAIGSVWVYFWYKREVQALKAAKK